MQNKNKLPLWDLSEYYTDINDKNIEIDIAKYKELTDKFQNSYRGKLNDIKADDFFNLLQELEAISRVSSKLGGYASLNSATNMTDNASSALYQNVIENLTDSGKNILFFNLEYNKLSQSKIDELFKDERIEFYRPFLTRLVKYKPYELAEDVEQTLMEKDITSGSAWVRMYEEYSARLKYYVDGVEYNDAQISKLCLSNDAIIRAKAGAEINRVSKENSYIFCYIYNMIIKDKAIEDEKRGFNSPISARNLAEEVNDKTVENLANTVRNNYQNIAHRYYKIKAKLLGLNKLSYWDRNAPLLNENDKEYTWEETTKIVLDAYKEFSPKLYDVAKEFFVNSWIDVPPYEGKRDGAFCSTPIVDEHPFLLLNFVGKRNDVLTLAHELGHGCHHVFRQNNGLLNERTRMTSEEIASVFGEMLTFQSMLKNTKDKNEKISLLSMKINDMINTAIRQISFHFFEKRVHDERKSGELSEARFSEIWQEEIKASLGDGVIVNETSTHIWAQIGHFFFLPFYVYAYSFADCVVNSLYWLKSDGKIDNFEDKYLTLLSQTAIKDYKDVFAPFGLDLEEEEFWQGGLNLISTYLDELESLID